MKCADPRLGSNGQQGSPIEYENARSDIVSS